MSYKKICYNDINMYFKLGGNVNKKILLKLILVCSAVIATCGLIMTVTQDESTSKVTAETVSISGNSSTVTTNFINSIGETARQIGRERDLYASVMIAQAILESGSGQSGLSKSPYYNYFGVKGSYQNQSVTMSTWEDDGSGNAYKVDQEFRSYGSISDSLEDYSNLLRWDVYAGAWKSNTSSYEGATKALTGLYATDTAYGDKLNNLIAYYGLTSYDSALSDSVWNTYRKAYTDAATLAEDESWVRYNN